MRFLLFRSRRTENIKDLQFRFSFFLCEAARPQKAPSSNPFSLLWHIRNSSIFCIFLPVAIFQSQFDRSSRGMVACGPLLLRSLRVWAIRVNGQMEERQNVFPIHARCRYTIPRNKHKHSSNEAAPQAKQFRQAATLGSSGSGGSSSVAARAARRAERGAAAGRRVRRRAAAVATVPRD